MTEETKIILEKLEEMNSKISDMDSRISNMDSKISDMDSRISDMDSKMSNMDSRISDMDSRISDMDSKISDIQLTLENETNKNIQIIAEGHLDLSRKLDEAMATENEKEMLLIRVNRLENELRKIKERLEKIA